MGRKRKRRGRKNLISRIFALVGKFLRHLQKPSVAPRKRRRRRKKGQRNPIYRLLAIVVKLFGNQPQPSVNRSMNPPQSSNKLKKGRKSHKKARLKIVSKVRDFTITIIQE